jgi:hypothetical protein
VVGWVWGSHRGARSYGAPNERRRPCTSTGKHAPTLTSTR